MALGGYFLCLVELLGVVDRIAEATIFWVSQPTADDEVFGPCAAPGSHLVGCFLHYVPSRVLSWDRRMRRVHFQALFPRGGFGFSAWLCVKQGVLWGPPSEAENGILQDQFHCISYSQGSTAVYASYHVSHSYVQPDVSPTGILNRYWQGILMDSLSPQLGLVLQALLMRAPRNATVKAKGQLGKRP